MPTSAGALGDLAAIFTPLEAERRSDVVARRIGDAIALGLLPDGRPLPAEADLAERLGVATTTLRDALIILRRDNLIETRRGRGGGSFVRAPADGGRQAMLDRLGDISLGDLRDLADHYAAISAMAAQLAAERSDEDELARLLTLAPACHSGRTRALRRQGESNFHIEVAAAGQSARLTREELALQNDAGLLLWLSFGEPGAARMAARRHREVVDRIEARDGPGASTCAQLHVREMFAQVRELHREAWRRGRG